MTGQRQDQDTVNVGTGPAGTADRRHRWPAGKRGGGPVEFGDGMAGAGGIHGEIPGELLHRVTDMSDSLRHLLKGTPTLQTASYVVPASGVVSDQYRAPYAALAVTSLSANPLLITSQPAGPGAPGPGPGSGWVPVRGFAAHNLAGNAWTLYGGAAGDLVTVSAFTKPVPPVSVPGPGSGGLAPSGASLTAYGDITTPGAGASIATVTSTRLVAGTIYQVTVTYYYNGTPASPNDDDNMKVFVNGGGAIVLPINASVPAAAAEPVTTTFLTPPVNGTNAMAVEATNLATTGAIYHATIVATPMAAVI
jgi:hypothetical protein